MLEKFCAATSAKSRNENDFLSLCIALGNSTVVSFPALVQYVSVGLFEMFQKLMSRLAQLFHQNCC